MEKEVSKWLDGCGFSEFTDHFLNEGYDDLEVISEMKANDLEDIGISKKGHIKKLMLKIEDLQKTLRKERILQNIAPQKKTRILQTGQYYTVIYMHIKTFGL